MFCLCAGKFFMFVLIHILFSSMWFNFSLWQFRFQQILFHKSSGIYIDSLICSLGKTSMYLFLIVVPFILVWIRVLYILISPFNSLFIVFADCCSIHWKRGDSVSCHALQKMWRTEPVLLGVQCGIKPLQFLPCHAEYQMSWHCIWSWWNAHSCKHNAFFWR